MRKQIELLEHHTDFLTDKIDIAEIITQLNTINDNCAALMLLQTIQGSDKCRFPGARGTTYHRPFAFFKRGRNPLEDVEIVKPFVYILTDNNRIFNFSLRFGQRRLHLFNFSLRFGQVGHELNEVGWCSDMLPTPIPKFLQHGARPQFPGCRRTWNN